MRGHRELLAASRPGATPGERPACLFDYFPEDFLVVVDESHVTLPQIGGMFNGDRARKLTLVDYGFRLPSALDNRPLMFDEFLVAHAARASSCRRRRASSSCSCRKASSSSRSSGRRGSIDPEIEVRPVRGQVDDLLNEIRIRERKGERVLVTTLTKRMAEDLTDYLQQMGVRVRYMHSDIDAIERMEIVRGLRLGEFDVLVGINLLREGLDLPEVSLVAILDADQEGFLRSDRSLIQTVGRAARHVERPGDLLRRPDHRLDAAVHRGDEPPPRDPARVQRASTASRRRQRVEEHRSGAVHHARRRRARRARGGAAEARRRSPSRRAAYAAMDDRQTLDRRCSRQQMREAATDLDFEAAARLRDQLFEVKAQGGRRARREARGASRTMRRIERRLAMRTHHIVPPLAAARRARHDARGARRAGASGSAARRTPPLVVAHRRRARRGKDDARAGDLRGYGVTEEVTSPTFALVHEYAAPRSPVYHLDLYRLDRPDELDEHRLGRDRRRARARARRVARARRRPIPPRARADRRSQHLPDDPERRLLLRRVARVITLALEASTYAGSVAVLRDGDAARRATRRDAGREHEERLMPAVADVLLERPASTPSAIDASCAAPGREASRACASPARSPRGSRSRRVRRSFRCRRCS